MVSHLTNSLLADGLRNEEHQEYIDYILIYLKLATENSNYLLGRLPPELFRVIVDAAPCSLYAYISLLSLSHAIRLGIRGTPRELSFVESQPVLSTIIRPTPDALAALVGPCKALRKLSFPAEERWGFAMDGGGTIQAGWADEAFGGHTQLAVLTALPALPDSTVERILRHLPGLVELTVNPSFPVGTRLLAAFARCPGLQVLRCTARACDHPKFTALAPLTGVLRQLALQDDSMYSDVVDTPEIIIPESLTVLMGHLTALTSLRLPCRCPPAALEPFASHLTSIELEDTLGDSSDLPGPWLCHLETLSLSLESSLLAPLTRLLAANQATLRNLRLKFDHLQETQVPSLVMALCALPHLTGLRLSMMRGCSLADLPSALVDRLERLDLDVHAAEPTSVCVASSHLQELRLAASTESLTLRCPRLRTIALPTKIPDGVAPMPDLEVADFHEITEDPAWLLTGSSSRLRELSGVRLTQPDLLARLCACGSLVRLERLRLDATRFPNPLILRLPGQLERLDLQINGIHQPLDLQVEAPGLIDLSVAIFSSSASRHAPLPSAGLRLRNCPSLARLVLRASCPMSLQVDEEEDPAEAGVKVLQPRSLIIGTLIDAASLLGLLTRHGARLRTVSVRQLRVARREDWPQLVGALSGLPRLTDLDLSVAGAPSPLSLACPQLRRLLLDDLPDEAKVVLTCPMLEELRGIRDRSRQVEFALPAPNLRGDRRW
ncbi:hypothetical protein PAPYR_533 [Paratrimastix pyriformis]|uniref:Uncharacterized protein n=1 Tax=Paratrimastix pyriformis TaxID=342808 RepID=A0ABQ8UYU8_9EUKA|nr:hypothetical protein PAPYR_533 [Paratrimastix pyriformis]